MKDPWRRIRGWGSRSELEPLAVIDIGSNSVRMVVYEGAIRSPQPIYNEKVLCGLGRNVGSTGALGEEPTRRALTALARFGVITRLMKVKNVRAIATAAVREAADGPDFIAAGERACGAKIEILSGAKEAELAAAGVAMGFMRPDGIAGDLGGGSLELIDIGPTGQAHHDASLPLGGLRLYDSAQGRLETGAKLAAKALARVGWLKADRARPFYAVGGTWRAFAKLYMAEVDYPLHVMHGFVIPTDDAIAFAQKLQKEKRFQAMEGLQLVSKGRRDMLPWGAAVLEQVLKRLRPSCVIMSVYGVREGLLFSLLSKAERERDPLLAFCADYAANRSRAPDYAHQLCAWTDPLFTAPGPPETPAQRRLRHAACLVSDVAWRAHPDYRGAQSLNVIAHAGLVGIDHPGRVFLALTAYFRHVGTSKASDDGAEFSAHLREIAGPDEVERAQVLGAALRAAHVVSMGEPGIIDEMPLSYGEDTLCLTLPKPYVGLSGDRVERRFANLGALLGRTFELRVAP